MNMNEGRNVTHVVRIAPSTVATHGSSQGGSIECSPADLRKQNGGDYLIPGMQLRPGLETAGASGLALHVTRIDTERLPSTGVPAMLRVQR